MFVSIITIFREMLGVGLSAGIVLVETEKVAGRSLHALIGYSARPSGIQLRGLTLHASAACGIVPRHGPRARGVAAVLLAALLAASPPARADEPPTLTFRQHRFVPARIVVPAHVKFRLRVQNTDDAADEFESTDLNREKLVPAGSTITVFLGPLAPGEYRFFGDFHQDTAQGVLVAK